MTREEAMAVIMRLNIINTGAPSAWIEATIRIVQAAAAAEREACAKVCDGLKWHKAPVNFAENCAAAIRARGET